MHSFNVLKISFPIWYSLFRNLTRIGSIMATAGQPKPSNWNDNKTPNVIAAVVVLGLLGPTTVALRIFARRKSHAKLWWDDCLIIFAAVG